MVKTKILIAGGSHADIPIIKAAQKLGYFVITSGNKVDDLGHKYSDRYIPADFSDKEAILKIATQEKISGICAGANDFSALSSAYTAEKLGLFGHDDFETSQIIHYKDKYRKFALENKILTPLFKSFKSPEEVFKQIDKFPFPVIVKPVDLTGGKGISVAQNKSELKEAVKKAFSLTRANRIIIEEYLQGSRHGFSTFLQNGKIKFYFADNEHYYLNPYLVAGASTPSNVSSDIVHKLINDSENIAQSLKLKDGIFHIQFILKEEQPYIIEICRRTPGDLYVQLVQYATGINYPEWIFKASIGEVTEVQQAEVKGYYLRHCVMPSNEGIIRDILYDKTIQSNIIEEFLWWKNGEEIKDKLTHKCGIIFLKFDTFEEMMGKTTQMQELIKVDVKK